MTLPEVLLWRALRQRPAGIKFRKQHPVGTYVLDFFSAAVNLCIEVDGEVHGRGDQPSFDQSRDEWLALHDIVTLRIPATDILNDLDGVVAHIIASAQLRLPLHHPAAPDGPPPRPGEVLP